MNEFMIHNEMKSMTKRLMEIEKDKLKAENQTYEYFIIWLKGFLDGNISKRGEGKE